jgi:hypothetical protein
MLANFRYKVNLSIEAVKRVWRKSKNILPSSDETAQEKLKRQDINGAEFWRRFM